MAHPVVAWLSEDGGARFEEFQVKGDRAVKRKRIAERVGAFCGEADGCVGAVVMESWSLHTNPARLAVSIEEHLEAMGRFGTAIQVPTSIWRKWILGTYRAKNDDALAYVQRAHQLVGSTHGVAYALCLAEFGLKLMKGEIDWLKLKDQTGHWR